MMRLFPFNTSLQKLSSLRRSGPKFLHSANMNQTWIPTPVRAGGRLCAGMTNIDGAKKMTVVRVTVGRKAVMMKLFPFNTSLQELSSRRRSGPKFGQPATASQPWIPTCVGMTCVGVAGILIVVPTKVGMTDVRVAEVGRAAP